MAGMGYAVMGTGVRSGNNRAVEAAMAAMASPLLEAGAIDGARGILINITGSSNLKLSEVNEASGIIQNAAHEDANIIFGAVQDETMGDEVKITVIATGFKHQEMPQRRERMLAEATLPTMRYDVPIQPRVATSRPAETKFASEAEVVSAPAAPVAEVQTPAAVVVESLTPVELVPVPASVFDDDFFRASSRAAVSNFDRVESATPDRFREPTHFSPFPRVQQESVSNGVEEIAGGESTLRVPSFGGVVAVPATQSEPDELDIPAFLRRGN
jgi:cell division protein FtsZ